MKVLVINAGSSSLKYQFIDIETEAVLAKGLSFTFVKFALLIPQICKVVSSVKVSGK